MEDIELLEKVLKQEGDKNTEVMKKQAWLIEHGFNLEAQSLGNQTKAVYDVLQQIRLIVVDKLIT